MDIGLSPIMRIIERLPDDDSIWPDRERYWIQRATELGCRLTNLDEGGLSGFKKHPSTIEKIRQVKTGTKHSEYTKRIMSDMRMGHKTSTETRAKISASHIGIKQSDESREKIRAARAKQVISEETKAKLSAVARGRIPSPQCIAASVAASKVRIISEDTRKLMRNAKLGKSLAGDHRAKLCIAQKLRWAKKKALQLGDQSLIEMSLAA